MNAHTPGPWEAGRNPKWDAGRSNGWVVRPAGEFPHGRWIADCGYPGEPEREANARLIAAAPEMLEALKAAAGELFRCGIYLSRHGQGATLVGLAETKARAAIAKAEGAS